MDTIIGLGSAGCNIARLFKNYPQYDVYMIDVDLEGEKCFALNEENNPEDYERNCPDLSVFLRHIDGDVLFVTSGGANVSGASLKILSSIKDRNINILYVKPDENELTRTGVLQERLVFNVFQQYARSGLFNTMYIVSNNVLEDIIGDVSILDRNDKINSFLVSAIHYINVFNNTDAVIDNWEAPKETARIATFGIYEFDNDDEKDMYPLQNVTDKCYYFAINEDSLKTDGKLLRKIRDHVGDNDFASSYQVHSTKHKNSFCYYIAYSNTIQTLDSVSDA